ncbi:MAG TPA: IucA/IucC family protein [Nitrosospira sp.]|nr:IucA/IucC family protein [Nitrosospira sp.]
MMPMPSYQPELAPIERRLVEQYLNTYCRETACFDPRLAADDQGPAELHSQINTWRASGWMPYLVTFGQTQYQLAGAFTYFSPIGYHRLAPCAWIGLNGDWQALTTDATPFTDLIADALVAMSNPAGRNQPGSSRPGEMEESGSRLKALMRNSIERVRRFHLHKPARGCPPFVTAEQGLRFGHIFHVTSKAAEGFSEEDIQRYAPELGASFRLHYFAVSADILETRIVGGQHLAVDPEVALFTKDLLCGGNCELIPCHPWQANYLLGLAEIKALIESGKLISLGPQGEVAWPTSSLRTVWLPRQNLFLKLSLNIRITNFIRNNPSEQVRRALDASLALSMLPRHFLEQPTFRILPELASQTLRLPTESLRAACAVVYREAMPPTEAEHVQTIVTVLEEPAHGEIPLLALLRLSAARKPLREPLVRSWWKHYLDATLLPLLRLFMGYGVSLEAHLQNTLIAFHNGWPVRGYVRDMEGASISRERFPFSGRLPGDSPALYPEEQAWHRFQYYVLVNHIGHVIACLAREGLATEAMLWRDTAFALSTIDDPLIRRLLIQPTLPAKANMLSSFYQRGESPSWVEIPNPMAQRQE